MLFPTPQDSLPLQQKWQICFLLGTNCMWAFQNSEATSELSMKELCY